MFTFPYVQPLCSLSTVYRFYNIRQGSMPPGSRATPLSGTNAGYWWLYGLPVDAEYWRALLVEYDDGAWHNNTDPNFTEREAVGRLLDERVLSIYPMPAPALIRKLLPLTTFPNGKHRRWRFTPCNAVEGNGVDVKTFNSTEQALAFLKPLTITDAHLSAIATLINPDAPPSLTLESLAHRLAHCESLAYNNLVVVEEDQPQTAAGRAAQSGSPERTTHTAVLTPASLDLGPHEQAGTDADEAVAPPQSLEECEKRLGAARKRLAKEGYQPKYSDEELAAIADNGELDDRFVARLIKARYATDSGYVGQPDADGNVKYWSTTFNQMENADTDPKTLCAVLGIDYKQGDDYTLAIIDTEAPGAGQTTTIVPTYDKLGDFSASEIDDLDPETVQQVMTPEYSRQYQKDKADFEASGGDFSENADIRSYASEAFDADADRQAFETRSKIDRKLGANEHYTGDGVTKNLLPSAQNGGVVETFSYDKNPQTLGALESAGSLKRVPCKTL